MIKFFFKKIEHPGDLKRRTGSPIHTFSQNAIRLETPSELRVSAAHSDCLEWLVPKAVRADTGQAQRLCDHSVAGL